VNKKTIPGRIVPGIFILVFLIAAVFFLFYPVKDCFVLEDAGDESILYCSSYIPDMIFGISYMHSVNKSKITDYFTLKQNGVLILTSSRFSSFGAGVATFPEESGSFSTEKDYINYTGIDRVIEDLVVFVGTVADHILILPESSIHLSEIAPPQTDLRFKLDRLSASELVYYYIKRGALHGKT